MNPKEIKETLGSFQQWLGDGVADRMRRRIELLEKTPSSQVSNSLHESITKELEMFLEVYGEWIDNLPNASGGTPLLVCIDRNFKRGNSF